MMTIHLSLPIRTRRASARSAAESARSHSRRKALSPLEGKLTSLRARHHRHRARQGLEAKLIVRRRGSSVRVGILSSRGQRIVHLEPLHVRRDGHVARGRGSAHSRGRVDHACRIGIAERDETFVGRGDRRRGGGTGGIAPSVSGCVTHGSAMRRVVGSVAGHE